MSPRSTSVATGRRRRAALRFALWLPCLTWSPWAFARWVDVDGLGWWAVAPQVFALYAFAVTAAGLFLATFARERKAATTAILGLIVMSTYLAERVTTDRQPSVARAQRIVILELNLNRGRANPNDVMRLITAQHADLVGFIELTPEELRRLDSTGLATAFPYRQAVPRENTGGLGVFSRVPSNWDSDLLPPPRVWMPAVVHPPPARPFRFEVLHASAPRPKTQAYYGQQTTMSDLPSADFKSIPVLVAGDFNSTLDGHRLRTLIKRGYRDAAEQMGQGLTPTWTGMHGLAALTIDHILVPPEFAVERIAVVPVDGTDHRALIAHLLTPGK